MGHGIVPNKSGKEFLPKTVPNDLIKHFFRGFIDGDGTINGSLQKGKRVCFGICSMSEKIIDDFIAFNNSDFHKYLYKNIYTAEVAAKDKVYKYINFYYKDATIYLDRKYEKFKTLSLEYENRKNS